MRRTNLPCSPKGADRLSRVPRAPDPDEGFCWSGAVPPANTERNRAHPPAFAGFFEGLFFSGKPGKAVLKVAKGPHFAPVQTTDKRNWHILISFVAAGGGPGSPVAEQSEEVSTQAFVAS